MNGHETRKLIKESLLTPSDNFADELMEKVVNLSEPSKTLPWIYILAGILCVSFLIFPIWLPKMLPEFSFYNISFNISPTFIQIFFALFILYAMGKLLEIHNTNSIFKKIKTT